MTVAAALEGARARGLARQLLMVVLINIPTVSLGLAMGWVSLASGERGGAEEGGRVVVAAATTFLASVVGVPLAARALACGRKLAVIATSACFVVCWSLKLVGGGWWVVAARVAAGLGGAGAYSIPPLIAREMCEVRIRGAASSALILAHNLGFLLMYLAADLGMQHSTVAWTCLGVSAVHCALFLLMPESPAFLAAQGREKEAAASLAWLRGLPATHPALATELASLPAPELLPLSPFALLKDMVSMPGRRRAFIISFVAIVGQEACGVYTLLQFAERVFVLARDAGAVNAVDIVNTTLTNATIGVAVMKSEVFDSLSNATGVWTNVSEVSSAFPSGPVLVTPARQAVILGAVQLVASAIGLYLVEKVGRRRLLVWSALSTALCLGGGAGAVLAEAGGGGGGAAAGGAAAGGAAAGGAAAGGAAAGGAAAGGAAAGGAARVVAGVALAAAVGADSVGLQPAPYALLADMFHYQYRSCALMVISVAANIASALEVGLFPALVARGGLAAALLLAATLAGAYALFALLAVPETKGRSPEEIYDMLAPKTKDNEEKGHCNEYGSYITRV